MTSRLLFAAARGARIQLLGRDLEWHEATAAPLKRQTFPYRIHPNDEHLQYGPISTALRGAAVAPPAFAGSLTYPVWGHVCEDMKGYILDKARKCRLHYEHVDELHRSLFLLILAEALADSGL